MRCAHSDCKKKLSLTDQISNKCKCGLLFCKKHLLSGNHSCNFDYQASAKQILNSSYKKLEKPKVEII